MCLYSRNSQTCPKERYTDVASNGSSPVTDQNWIQYLLYLNQLWYIFIWNSHLVEQVFDFLKEKCFTWICLDWGMNPGPPRTRSQHYTTRLSRRRLCLGMSHCIGCQVLHNDLVCFSGCPHALLHLLQITNGFDG